MRRTEKNISVFRMTLWNGIVRGMHVTRLLVYLNQEESIWKNDAKRGDERNVRLTVSFIWKRKTLGKCCKETLWKKCASKCKLHSKQKALAKMLRRKSVKETCALKYSRLETKSICEDAAKRDCGEYVCQGPMHIWEEKHVRRCCAQRSWQECVSR